MVSIAVEKPKKKTYKNDPVYWIKRGFSEQEAKVLSVQNTLPVKKLFKSNPLYWKLKGFSDKDSEEQAIKFKGTSCRGNYKFYLSRGIASTVSEAKELAKTWASTRSSLSKSYLLAKFKNENEYIKYKQKLAAKALSGNRVTDISYWIKKGFSEEEAKNQITLFKKEHSPRRIELWIMRGFSIEEARKKVSSIQSKTSKQSFINRYGEHEGLKRYFLYIAKVKSVSKYCTIQGQEILQRKATLQNKMRLTYWKNLGFSDLEAEKLRMQYIKIKNRFFVDFWIDKGYTEEEARNQILDDRRNTRAKVASTQNSRFGKSKMEIKVGEALLEQGLKLSSFQPCVKDPERNKLYFPDFFIETLDCYLEFFGDYWHRNPIQFSDPASIKIQENDMLRLQRIEEISKKKVIVLWEDELYKNGYNNLRNAIERKLRGTNEN